MGCDMSFIKKAKMGRGAETTTDEMYDKRVLFLGLDNAGKTSLLFQMRDNQFKQTVPTIGLNIETLTHKRYNFTFWDVGGQATKLWKHYFDKIDGVVFVIDATDEEKLLFAKEEFTKLQKDESLQMIPFLLLFNKVDDVLKAKSSEELSARLEVEQAREEREIAISRCSAKLGEGIWEGIDMLIDIFERRKHGQHLFPIPAENLQNEESRKQESGQKGVALSGSGGKISALDAMRGASAQMDSDAGSSAAKETKMSTGRGNQASNR